MNGSSRRCLPLLAPLLACGCFATQRDILDLSQQYDSIRIQNNSLKKIMGELQGNQADLNVKLDELHKGLSVLNENLKDNRDDMSRLAAKMDDLGAVIGTKVSSMGKTLDESRSLVRATEEKLVKEGEERRRAEEALKKKQAEEEARRQAEAEGPSPSELYRSARVQLDKKQYDLAVQGFQVYLEKFPKGEVVDMATYYIGQARYLQGRWKDAATQYALVLDRYPKSEVTPSARLRYALCLINMKTHLDEAKRYLESIPQDFPNTPEARKALELNKELGAKAAPKKKPAKPR
ncbi:MAG: hypothetical protein A2X36_10190 [Elusimicrobia bacterium GWA2_69_24]|nr:MAG: hypothetical protein A2X36_10190 [Elusimicrobia bacterium GWA2_69_24]HBL19207.1 hypothetical protein [Elusimicrobiota bacterium]